MRFFSVCILFLSLAPATLAWSPRHGRATNGFSLQSSVLATASSDESTSTIPESSGFSNDEQNASESLTMDLISKLRYRELRHQLEARGLSPAGTTAQMRSRLRAAVDEECDIKDDGKTNDNCGQNEVSFVGSIVVGL